MAKIYHNFKNVCNLRIEQRFNLSWPKPGRINLKSNYEISYLPSHISHLLFPISHLNLFLQINFIHPDLLRIEHVIDSAERE